jgi:signal transduction histidine kinase
VVGALVMLNAKRGAFTTYHRGLAEGLSRWASIVLENAKLYAQSQELIGELEKSNEAKSDFLGIVSHELRTPITTIYGGTLLLRLRRDSLPEQAFNDMIVSISEEAERLHHLVQDLLTIARTELVTEPRPIKLSEVIQTAITDFASTHRRTVEVNLEPELPPAIADATYIRQVITNLISNADKYTPLEEPIEIKASHVGNEIVVRVNDNGEGIAAEDLPQVFDSFYRSKDAVERASGSGLGLTVCKRLVETLGGRIWAQNRPEGGLEVGFTLKAADTTEPVAVSNGHSVKGRSQQQPAEAAQGTSGAGAGEA